jgi:hypothetical protein
MNSLRQMESVSIQGSIQDNQDRAELAALRGLGTVEDWRHELVHSSIAAEPSRLRGKHAEKHSIQIAATASHAGCF